MEYPKGIQLGTQGPAVAWEIVVAAAGPEPAPRSTAAGFDCTTQPKQVQAAGGLGF